MPATQPSSANARSFCVPATVADATAPTAAWLKGSNRESADSSEHRYRVRGRDDVPRFDADPRLVVRFLRTAFFFAGVLDGAQFPSR